MKKQLCNWKTAGLASLVLGAAMSVQAIVLVPTPDFTQWGKVNGHNAAVALVYDGSSWSVFYNPAESPYDGSEDSYVGVLNASTSSVASLALAGSNIFGFDGDGQQSFTGNNNGPTGYEGPNTSFTVANSGSGTVNFTGGLAGGGKAWFTLEETISIANPITPTPVGAPDAASTLALLSGAMGALGLVRRSLKK